MLVVEGSLNLVTSSPLHSIYRIHLLHVYDSLQGITLPTKKHVDAAEVLLTSKREHGIGTETCGKGEVRSMAGVVTLCTTHTGGSFGGFPRLVGAPSDLPRTEKPIRRPVSEMQGGQEQTARQSRELENAFSGGSAMG